MSAEERQGSLGAAKIALAVKRMRAQTEGIELLAAEPLAVVGMGCRFPGGAENPDRYWQMLEQGTDAVREIPKGRWKENPQITSTMRRGGYLENVDSFDAEFFGISPREAEYVDPQHRILLEVVWESLWDAGISPESLSGARAGIFVALYSSDYVRMVFHNQSLMDSYASVSAANCMAAGRLSFLLNVHGPSTLVDTACSSSLTATHLACQSLRNREADIAIAAASSLKLLPDEVMFATKWGMLAADARCKTFDERADGYVPGEGCGAVIIKRLADALANGDHVRAIIRGSAINHDGRTTVMTAPNGLAQESVIRAALHNAAVDPADVSFVETHGTGTSLGDPIEVEALRSVYGEARPDSLPCVLGAVKTNLGHLEAAAGLAGLIKAVLCLEQEKIPRNLHFEQLSSRIPLDGSRLTIPTEPVEWHRTRNPRFAAVSSFGLSGTNAHMILEEAPLQLREPVSPEQEQLLVISAKSQAALKEMAANYSRFLISTPSESGAICAAAAKQRSHYQHRLAFIGDTQEDLQRKLDAFLNDHIESDEINSHASTRDGSSERHTLLLQAAEQYIEGKNPNWLDIFPSSRGFVPLPLYPWQRKKFWLTEPGADRKPVLSATQNQGHPLLGSKIDSAFTSGEIYDSYLNASQLPYLIEQGSGARIMVPIAVWIEIAAAAISATHGTEPFALLDVELGRPLLLSSEGCRIQTLVEHDSFSIASRDESAWQIQVSGRFKQHTAGARVIDLEVLKAHCTQPAQPSEIYESLEQAGLKSHASLRPITSLWTSKNEALAYVKLPATLVPEENSYQMHPVLLESCLQVAWAALDTNTRDIFIPTNIARYEFFGSANEVWTHIRLLPSQADNITAEIVIVDAHGNVITRIEGLNARRSTPASMPPDSQIVAELLHAPIAERRKMLAQHIEKFVRSVMGLDETYAVDENEALQDLGLDSLMAVELRNLLQRSLGRDLRSTIVFDYPSIASLAEYLDTLLWAADELPANSSASQRDEIRI